MMTIDKVELAQNPHAKIEKLIELSKEEDSIIKSCVARNPNTPVHVLEYLSKDDHSTVSNKAQFSLSRNINATPEMLFALSTSDDIYVILGLVNNKNTNTQTLSEIFLNLKSLYMNAKDDIQHSLPPSIFFYMAKHKNISSKLLDKLYLVVGEYDCDSDYPLRPVIAQNINTSNELLKKIANDPNHYCRHDALRTLIKKKNLKLFA